MANFTLNQGTETGNPYPLPEKGTTKEKTELTFQYIQDLHERTQKIEGGLEETRQKNDEQNNRNIEILAVFVTLFTFISIETQLLRSGISFLTAVGFSILILGGLMIFLFSLRFFLENDWKNFSQFLLLLVFGGLMMAGGLFVIWQGEKSYYKDIDNRFYSKSQIDEMINSNKSSLDKFKECLVVSKEVANCLQ